jgi:hypothetical protein
MQPLDRTPKPARQVQKLQQLGAALDAAEADQLVPWYEVETIRSAYRAALRGAIIKRADNSSRPTRTFDALHMAHMIERQRLGDTDFEFRKLLDDARHRYDETWFHNGVVLPGCKYDRLRHTLAERLIRDGYFGYIIERVPEPEFKLATTQREIVDAQARMEAIETDLDLLAERRVVEHRESQRGIVRRRVRSGPRVIRHDWSPTP